MTSVLSVFASPGHQHLTGAPEIASPAQAARDRIMGRCGLPKSLHLCETCRHCQPVRTARSVFHMCRRHKAEPAKFRKYPPIPVVTCPGYEAGSPDEGAS